MKKYENEILNELIERFYRYTSVASQSNDQIQTLPSSMGQMELALILDKELNELGLEEILLTEDAILTARLKGNTNSKPIGFVAHLDTVDIGLSDKINPQILFKEEGVDLLLNEEKNIYLKESLIPEIKKYQNQDIIVTDGTSVLGADNKASITVIMTILNYLIQNPSIKHGDLYVAFVPDEEIGLRGAKALDPKRLPVACAYTIDSNELGEIIFETFNAGSAKFTIEGITAHPMSAKNVLVNPLMIAHEAISMLDRAAMPEHTELKEGYIWPTDLIASPSKAELILNIRDHNLEKYNEKKLKLQKIHEFLQMNYKNVNIELVVEDVYANIANSIASKDEPSVAFLEKAMQNCDIEPKYMAMRGGTDGSALSAKGIPTPNYFTGAHQFHSIYEFLPVESFYKCFLVTKELIQLWAK